MHKRKIYDAGSLPGLHPYRHRVAAETEPGGLAHPAALSGTMRSLDEYKSKRSTGSQHFILKIAEASPQQQPQHRLETAADE